MKLEQFLNTQKGQRDFIWLSDNVIELVRNDSRNADNYATKHDLLFGELAYLLNEGYIKVELETYALPIFEERKEKIDELCEQVVDSPEKDAALEEIIESSTYYDDVFIRYAIWEHLYAAGARTINFKHKQCAILATDTHTIVTLGNVDIEFLFEALEKGIEHIYIAHYTKQTTANVFILRPTEKLQVYFSKKNKEHAENIQFFSKIAPSTETEMYREIPLYEDEILHQLDLIEFVNQNKVHRGQVVCELPNGTLGYDVALQFLGETSVRFPETKFTIMFEQNEHLSNSVLVKRPIIRNDQEEYECYIINKAAIKTLIPYDYVGWVDQILCTFMFLNPANTLNIEYIGTDESRDIHTPTVYDPITHTLKVAVVNLVNHAMYHYFYNRIHPFDTFEKVLAHEVGHVDALVELVAHYNDILKELQVLNKQINENIKVFEVDYTNHQDLIIETMMLIDEKISLLQDFYTDKLTDIQYAYENGLDYISPNLSYPFQKDAFQAYQVNKEMYARQLYKLYEQRYALERLSKS